jgi:hypothetical protein
MSKVYNRIDLRLTHSRALVENYGILLRISCSCVSELFVVDCHSLTMVVLADTS